MKRILPEQVKAAAERTHIKPIQDHWVNEEDYNPRNEAFETRCGCGLSIMAIDSGSLSWEQIAELESRATHHDTIVDQLAENVGVSGRYAAGFVEGFDAHPGYPGSFVGEEQQGYEDGIAACNLLFANSYHARCTHTCKHCEVPIVQIGGVWRDYSDGDACEEGSHEPFEACE